MAVANGFGKVVTSGSVFMYDTGDTVNSYKGQPTTNAVGNLNNFNPLDLYTTWASSGNACTLSKDTIQSPVGNTPLKMVVLGNDSYTNTYNNTGNNISAASSGQTWTISVWAKANQNTVGQIFHFGANSSGNYIDFDATGITITTEWTRYSYTRTFTDGNVVAIQTRLDGPDTFQSGDIIWWDGLQVEQKSYATQFTTGTRSATQGLLPIVGNSTIDLSNVSFDSNAQIIFDGTDDFIDTNFPSITLNTPTIEAVVYRSTNTGRYEAIIQNNFVSDDALYVYPNGTLGFWPCAASSLTVPTGQWSYVAVSYDGTNLIYSVNGVTQTITATCADITDWDFLRIGGFGAGDGERWIGKIAVSKVYDRALTVNEFNQNYNKYKTRFNLP
jgi:hypothetical protein